MKPVRWVPVLALGVLAAAFAWANRGEAAVLHLGVASLYQVPVSLMVLGAFLLGMVAMLLLSLPVDLRVRRELRERRREEEAAEPYPGGYAQSDYS